ncbi:hypothetical protein E2C01_092097 [Portunus trituberculatus]|uniref:Uncharacterized protein n=1 Tax=Portunus trituberculatus TaxID=210409 RepID=A0A5B7JUW5_PORTR|nr:hypothetical protein [Portunus trituberculatus]
MCQIYRSLPIPFHSLERFFVDVAQFNSTLHVLFSLSVVCIFLTCQIHLLFYLSFIKVTLSSPSLCLLPYIAPYRLLVDCTRSLFCQLLCRDCVAVSFESGVMGTCMFLRRLHDLSEVSRVGQGVVSMSE